MLKVLDNDRGDNETTADEDAAPTLDELARTGARQMFMTALAVEVAQYVDAHQEARDEQGRRLVVRNGRARTRKVTCGAGTLEVSAPRVHDRRVAAAGQPQRFTSRILPPYMRRSPKVAEVLQILYLRGLSMGDFREALPVLLGDDAAGLSATNIARLTAVWEEDYRRFRQRDLADRDYVYVWVDGIYCNIRLEDDRLCILVMIGVRPDGTKELVALEEGDRESTDSWATVLRDLHRRGMGAPVVAVGDGALGFWAAVRDVWPETQEQRDWFHKMGNVLDKLPTRLQPKATRALREIIYADTRAHAEEAMNVFIADYEAKYPKAAACLDADRDRLLTHCALPAEHWQHVRTSNVIESPFATVRLRQRVTKGAGSRTKGRRMAYKLLEMAQQRWRRLNGAHLLPLVRAGVTFIDGVRQERSNEEEREEAA